MNYTNIALYENVGFTDNDTMHFKTQGEQGVYFNQRMKELITGRYNVITGYIDVPSETFDFYDLQNVDYVGTSRHIGVNVKPYYYRVTSIESLNDRVTRLMLKLDVIQTYMFDYNIETAYIEREHQDRKKEGKNKISRTHEPVGVNEYDFIESELTLDYHKFNPDLYALVISKKESSDEEIKDIYGSIPQGFATYISFFRYGRINETDNNL